MSVKGYYEVMTGFATQSEVPLQALPAAWRPARVETRHDAVGNRAEYQRHYDSTGQRVTSLAAYCFSQRRE
jgi:hypothetical protein